MAKVRNIPESREIAAETPASLNLLSLIETAYKRARLKQEYLAEVSGVKLSTLNGALTGAQNFNVRWLESWPEEFWFEFLPLLKAEREQTPAARRALIRERLKSAIDDLIEIAEVSA